MTTRTDVHRPSVIEPADYRFVAFDYLRNVSAEDTPMDMSRCTYLQAERERIRLDMVATGGAMSDHAHGGNCMVCGNANAIYTAMFHHAPTNAYVRMGSDCSHHVNASLDHDQFERFRNRVAAWVSRENRIPRAQAELRSRGFERFVDMAASTGTFENRDETTAQSIVSGLVRYGSLTDAQWRFLTVLRDRIVAPAGAAVAAPAARPNRFPGNCTECHTNVAVGEGTIDQAAGRWTVRHNQCPVQPTPASLSNLVFTVSSITDESPNPVVVPTPTPAAPANVGEMQGIMTLFGRARQHLRQPNIVLSVPGDSAIPTIRLTIAGPTARVPGSINVLSEARDYANRRAWLGRVLEDGTFSASRHLQVSRERITQRLQAFAANPAQVAGEHGRLTGRCCFCRLPLTDERSTAVGYGPICAGHFGLPWGDRPAEFAAPVATATPAVARAIEREPSDLQQVRRTVQNLFVTPPTVIPRPLPPTAPATGLQCLGCEAVGAVVSNGNEHNCRDCGAHWRTES